MQNAKYGEALIFQLEAIDFLFDLNTVYGPIGHRFDARNYLWSQKYWNVTTADLNNAFRQVNDASGVIPVA